MTYSFGDVLLVPHPCTERGICKKRPAIVVSNSIYNNDHKALMLIAVTGCFNPALHPNYLDIKGWQQAGLLKPSVIKPVIKTVPVSFVFKKMGSLIFADKRALKEFLYSVMG